MMHWPTIFSGLGLIHYWSIAESFRQYHRLVSKKLLFDTFSYIWVLALGADFACLLAWMLGLSAPSDGGFWEIIAVVLVPLTIIIFTLLNLFNQGKVKPNSAVDQYFNNAPKDAKNLFAICFSSSILLGLIYLTYDSFSEGGSCGETTCHFYEWLIGSKNRIFGGLTFYSLGANFIFGAGFLIIIEWFQKARLRTNTHVDE